MENFNVLEETTGLENQGTVTDAAGKDDTKKRKIKEMNQLFRDTVTADKTFIQKIHSLSNSLAVVNTLGFGESGNIRVDEATKGLAKDQRKLVTTSQIVGYKVQNIGETPIKYVTEEFEKNAEGVYVGKKVEKVLQPKETSDFTRKYMTMFCAQPEISFVLANGKIVRGSGSVKAGDIDGELEAHYFSFNDKDVKVNDDTIKLNVGKKIKGTDGAPKWIVKPEFEKVFGYLNNAKVSNKRAKGTGNKVTTQELAANYINRLIQEGGLI